jgi:hypothetical protein
MKDAADRVLFLQNVGSLLPDYTAVYRGKYKNV